MTQGDFSDYPPIQLTRREAKEVALCIIYDENYNHGTAGHNRMQLIAKLASYCGISVPNGRIMPMGNLEIVEGDER